MVPEGMAKRGGHHIQTLQPARTECEGWMCAVGGQSGHSQEREDTHTETAAPHAPGHIKDERSGTLRCMVAGSGHGD